MKGKAWLFVGLGAVVVAVLVYVLALGQTSLSQRQVTRDLTDIYNQLDIKLTEITEKLDAIIEGTQLTKAGAQRWAYMEYIGPAEDSGARGQTINLLGEAGWELVTAIWSQGEPAWHYVFKRPLD